MQKDAPNKVFVIAAKIAAELHFAVKQARELSLTAKNARAISVRAGDRTAGFRAITDYIDMLSQTTISQAQNINILAIKISRLSVELAKITNIINKYQSVMENSSDAPFISSLNKPFNKLLTSQQTLQIDFEQCNYQLSEAIHEARKQMRSANVIATSSKVEASRSGEFEEALTAIADNIETTSESIKLHLNNAIQQQN